MKEQEVVYSEPEIIQRQNGYDIIRRPILTDEERARRMKEIEKAAAALIIAKYEAEARRRKENENKQRRTCIEDTER